jgi:hypothetical protein
MRLSAVFIPMLLLSLPMGAQDLDRTLRPQQGAGPTTIAEARTALIIGNGAYHSAPLKNPVQDARAMAEALRKCGFRVTLLEDATRMRMVEALRDFGVTIQGGGVGLLYYAGHGMQVKGRNYLVPVDADLASEDEVPYNTLDADAVLAKMESARNRLNILILDACRNNPFARSFRSSAQGLAQMDAPAGSYIAFATSPGRTAADGTGTHGLYTQHLLDQLGRPGIKVEDVFKRVRASVMRDSQQQQVPWESSSITGDFYFVPGAPAEPPPVNPAPVGATLLDRCMAARGGTQAWQAVRTLRTKGKWPMDGTEMPFTRDESRGGFLRTESPVLEKGEKALVVMVLDGSQAVGLVQSGDRSQVLEPPTAMNGLEVQMMKNLLGLSDPLLAAAEGKARWEEAGASFADGRSLRQLRVQTTDGQEFVFGIDGTTFLPARVHARYRAGEDTVEQDFRLSAYQKVGPLLLPFRLELLAKETQTWIPRENLEEVQLNPSLAPDHFRLPKFSPGGPTDLATTDPARIRFAGRSWEVLEGTWRVEGDALIGASSKKGGQAHLIMDMGLGMPNYSVECDVECLSGWGWAGLLARSSVFDGGGRRFRAATSDIQAYAFNFSIDKTFNVFRGVKGFWSLANPAWTSWQPSPWLGGRKTHVRWQCAGKTLEVYAGQTLLYRFTDLELPRGSVAFALGEDATYRISNFKFRPLP